MRRKSCLERSFGTLPLLLGVGVEEQAGVSRQRWSEVLLLLEMVGISRGPIF